MINSKQLAQTLLGTVRAWVEPAFHDVNERLELLDARIKAIPAGEKGEPGKDVDPDLVKAELARLVADLPIPVVHGEPGPQGEPGESIKGERGEPGASVEPELIARLVDERVTEVVAKIPPGPAGKDAEPIHPDTVARMVFEEVDRRIAALPKPENGKDADPIMVEHLINAALAVMPKPDAEPAKEIDTAAIEARVAAAAQQAQSQMFEMIDELVRGFEDEAAAQPSPAMSINVSVPGAEPRPRAQANGTREATVLIEGVARRLQDVLMLPVVPVYDKAGRLLYGQRVDPNAQQQAA